MQRQRLVPCLALQYLEARRHTAQHHRLSQPTLRLAAHQLSEATHLVLLPLPSVPQLRRLAALHLLRLVPPPPVWYKHRCGVYTWHSEL